MKDAMSNTDIMLVLPEARKASEGAFIKNIYSHGQVFILKLYQPIVGNSQLLIEPGRRIHLTEFQRVAPKTPSKFVTVLRKYLRDKRVISLKQHDLDRIVVLEVGDDSGTHKLVAELFGDGNLILLDSDDRIFVAQHYKRMRDRDLVPKAKYDLPPPRGVDVLALDNYSLQDVMSDSKANVVRTLASRLNLDALSCEEICTLAGVSSKAMASDLDEKTLADLRAGLQQYADRLKAGVREPRVVLEEPDEGQTEQSPIAFLPFEFQFYRGHPVKGFDTFSQAIDNFFGVTESEKPEEETDGALAKERNRLQTIIDKQQESVSTLRTKAEELRVSGELIYAHLQTVQEVLETITKARAGGLSWEEIVQRIEKGKKKSLKSAAIIKRIMPSEAQIVMDLSGTSVTLDVRLSAQDNAAAAYEQAKRAEAKAEGAESQIEKTQVQLVEMQKTVEKAPETRGPLRARKQKWYERFRWFFSSEGFLVLGGRDAKSNELLAKRQMAANDVFLHAALHGAPYVVIKVPDQPPGQQTLLEAAQFAVSFSSAWQDGLSTGDAYWVNPEQVSFTPPTGEYLPQGAVMLYGTKNYIRGVPVEIAVGVVFEEDYVLPVSGPTSAVSVSTPYHVRVVPGRTSKGQLVKEILGHIGRMLEDDRARLISRMPEEDLMRMLPPGNGDLLS
ncbi:MAG: hypothetical protein C4K49_07380 [Candidatus Thorarchaeota archaeon]|nr:MAG: hypothetical protein C4K49_07380 [Candidatus Thorarchaeota archaeon]